MFDLDGTLIDSAPLFATIVNTMLEERGATFRIDHADARSHATAGGMSMMTALLGKHCGDPAEALIDFRARYVALQTPAESLYPGVKDALTVIAKSGVALAVWSNKADYLCEKVLRDLGLSSLFAGVVGTGKDVPLKPDSAGLDRALALTGSARDACCFVGDSDVDHESARLAGVPFVMVTHGYGDYDKTWPDAVMVDGFGSVPDVVRRLLTRDSSVA